VRSVHRAIADLNEGLHSLLGLREGRPALVEELLGGRHRRRSLPRRGRPAAPRPARRRAPAGRHLARVK
jgi:hypothetical protein